MRLQVEAVEKCGEVEPKCLLLRDDHEPGVLAPLVTLKEPVQVAIQKAIADVKYNIKSHFVNRSTCSRLILS